MPCQAVPHKAAESPQGAGWNSTKPGATCMLPSLATWGAGLPTHQPDTPAQNAGTKSDHTCRRGICTAAASTDSAANEGALAESLVSRRASLSPAATRLALQHSAVLGHALAQHPREFKKRRRQSCHDKPQGCNYQGHLQAEARHSCKQCRPLRNTCHAVASDRRWFSAARQTAKNAHL